MKGERDEGSGLAVNCSSLAGLGESDYPRTRHQLRKDASLLGSHDGQGWATGGASLPEIPQDQIVASVFVQVTKD